jgi:uncharacterized protein with NAD-binding domain and iron-sulfur cluster
MNSRPHAIVLGGGVAGFSAAQELCERGFSVDLCEQRTIPGGRARSFTVARQGSGRFVADPDQRLAGPHVPGEHGFRFFPGFYRHLFDTMARIPLPQGGSVLDNLVEIDEELLALGGQRHLRLRASAPRQLSELRQLLELDRDLRGLGLTGDDLQRFGDSLWRFATSCPARRNAEYEAQSWFDFVGADGRGRAYEWFLASGITRTLVAAQARWASAKTMGNVALQMWLQLTTPGGATDRVLNGPTNDAWFIPWLQHLQRTWPEAFRFHPGTRVARLTLEHERVAGLTVERGGRARRIGDPATHYISTLPPERLLPLLEAAGGGGPLCENLRTLVHSEEPRYLATMGGLQIYLARDHGFGRGHQILLDSPWGLSSISAAQFWPRRHRHLPRGMGVLSVDISSWDLPGRGGRRARDCSRAQVFRETVAQLRDALGPEGLEDDNIHGFYLDESLRFGPRGGLRENLEPILVNHCGAWALRPEAATDLDNLALAGDWIRTETDLACMEGANEAARRAVNVVLDRAGYVGPRCQLWESPQLPALAPVRALDSVRFKQGLPWAGGPCGRWLAPAAALARNLGDLVGAPAPGLQIASGRPLPEPPDALPAEAVAPADGPALAPLSPDEVARYFSALTVESTGWRNNRTAPLFERWPLHRPADADKSWIDRYGAWVAGKGPLDSDELVRPFHIYDGFALTIHGQADLAALEARVEGPYRPVVGRTSSGETVGYAYLWVMHHRDTSAGPYNEVVVNFAVDRERRLCRWRSPHAAVAQVIAPGSRLFTPLLLLDRPCSIQYGNDLLGTNKQRAGIRIAADRTLHRFAVADTLEGEVPVRESVFADVESTAKLTRELGFLESAKLTRQAARGEAARGALVTRDHRRRGRAATTLETTLEILGEYQFKPRLRQWNDECRLAFDGRSELAALLREMRFRPVTYAFDPNFMGVFYLDEWALPAAAATDQRAAG